MCAVDQRATRDGKVIEELGYYDTSVPETDARAILKGERINYWLSVGAQPSDKCSVLIKKYGHEGTHLAQQQEALDRLKAGRPKPAPVPAKPEAKAEEPAAEESAGEEAAAVQEEAASE